MNSHPALWCTLFWLSVVALPLLIVLGIGLPWNKENTRLDQEIQTNEDQLIRYRRVISTMPDLQAELERARKNDAYKAFYFRAATPALAGAELQHQVQEIVNQAKGRLISTQILPEEKSEEPHKVNVRTQIQCTTDGLLAILLQIERARPFLFIDQLSVRSSARAEISPPNAPGQPRRPMRRPPSEAAGDLTVRLDLFGFLLGGEA